MPRLDLVIFAGLAAIMEPSTVYADGTPSGVHGDVAGDGGRSWAGAHLGIPAWARRYNVNCSHCHAPAVPRLNETGIRFKWAGYRMPDEIGDPVEVQKIQNYIALRGRMHYDYAKTEGQPTSNSSFSFTDATIFYSGPFGRNYGAVFELEREAENSIELVAHVVSAWGKETSYGGFRAGQMHWLLREGVGGFDRPTGIRTPIPVNNTLTAGGIPFAFSNDQLGVEAYYVRGRNRVSAEVLSGINAEGKGDEGDPDHKKDFVGIDQFLLDDAGSSVMAVGYYGTLQGADALAPSTTSHFWRLSASANKFIQNFEVLGSIVYGKDTDLPVVPGGLFGTPEVKGLGYWFYGGYTFGKAAEETDTTAAAAAPINLTLYGRYEYLDPNTDVDANASRRIVVGAVLPVNLPEYIRLALEYAHDFPQGAALKNNAVTAELMLNF
jgi:hypothetical protein